MERVTGMTFSPHLTAICRRPRLLHAALVLLVALTGCSEDEFSEPMVFAGQEVPPDVLNLGKSTYTQYCRACHGDDGDGQGPAARGLRPPPRDLRDGNYKFVAVESGYLPNDEDFYRIIRGGLHGTAMLPWNLSDERLHAVTQYIKTFSDRWQDEYEEVGEPIVPGEDPFGQAREAEAITRGKKVYHALAQCISCHPAYATFEEIFEAGVELTGSGRSDLTARIYTPELRDTEYGVKVLPPDFTWHPVRSGETLADLYRSIASGIGGTAMPTWKGALEEVDIWAMAYYVRSLIQMRGTPEALALKQGLREQAPFDPGDQPGGG